jgi:nucleotidyltransferase substrate binding protein (TIGR01987 family)
MMHNFPDFVGEINITSLVKAYSKFEQFRKNSKTEQEKAGTIQAFEYCFELSWKTMKRILQNSGIIASSPREVLRQAALDGLIEDPEIWFIFLKKRNLTTHTYNEKEIESIIEITDSFSSELNKFLTNISKLNA